MNRRRWLWLLLGLAIGIGYGLWKMRSACTEETEEIPRSLEAVAA